jgi:outer membrane protein assembly factor BamE (lipoprotein component of BamABCDE complex)
MVPRIVSCALAALVTACAAYSGAGLKPGVTTEGEVVAAMGRPAATFPNRDGSRRLAYPKGPLGTQTYMADIAPDGRLQAISQVLNDQVFSRIQPGLTRDDVLRLIGPPGSTMRFPISGNDAWDYRFVDTWGYTAVFSVTFNRDNIVVSKISQRIERDRGSS